MIETIDTGGKGLRVGQYTFTISENPIKGAFQGGSAYYEWFFTVYTEGEIKEHKERVPVWKMGPILRALGQKETKPDVFDWDREGLKGLTFDGEIVMEKDYKNPSKSYARIANHRRLGLQGAAKASDGDEVPF